MVEVEARVLILVIAVAAAAAASMVPVADLDLLHLEKVLPDSRLLEVLHKPQLLLVLKLVRAKISLLFSIKND